MKKGYLLSFGMLMVMMTILAFAVSTNKIIEKNKERLSILGITDRVFDLSSSVEKGFKEILDIYADFDVLIEEGSKINVSITENISREKEDWGEELNEKISEFKNFIETQDNNIMLISGIFDKERPLEIRPYNITYFRSWETGQVTLNTVPKAINFDGFEILINSNSERIESLSAVGIKQGSTKFIVRAVDNYGFVGIEEKSIDASKQNQFLIKFVGGNQLKITINDNNLEIWTNTPEIITVTTKIFGLPKLPVKATVVYPDTIYNVTFPEFDIIKNGNIQFL